MEVVRYLGRLQRAFASGDLEEDGVANMEETHFIINIDNGKTLGFRGDEEVKYADVSSGGEGMTMVLKLTGGQHSKLLTPMLIFTNVSSSFPIRGLKDSVVGVTYRSGPKGFMDRRIFDKWLRSPRCDPLRNSEKVLFLDNYGGHNPTEKIERSLQGKHAITF